MKNHTNYLLVICTITLLVGNVRSDRNISGDSLLATSVLIKDSAKTNMGSGFLIDCEPNGQEGYNIYLVTAWHVLFNHKISTNRLNTQKITLITYPRATQSNELIKVHIDLQRLLADRNILTDRDNDIAIVPLLREVTNGVGFRQNKGVKIEHLNTKKNLTFAEDNLLMPFKDVPLASDIYMFGYPQLLNNRINRNKPLIIKGNVAAKNDKDKTIIVYCPAYGGNSGGPVIGVRQINALTTHYSIIGFVREFVGYEAQGRIITNGAPIAGDIYPVVLGNSGYAVIGSIDGIFDLIGFEYE